MNGVHPNSVHAALCGVKLHTVPAVCPTCQHFAHHSPVHHTASGFHALSQWPMHGPTFCVCVCLVWDNPSPQDMAFEDDWRKTAMG